MKKLVYKLKNEGWSLARTVVLFYVFPAILVAALVLKAKDIEKKPASVVHAAPGIPVDGQIIVAGAIHDNLEVTGTLVANHQVDVVSELTRRVVLVAVADGAHVKKGALLFQLDDADLQAQLERYHQQEKLAHLNEQRLSDLIAHEAIAQQDYDEASTGLNVLRAQIKETEVMIGKTRILAPFDGQIGMIPIHAGAVVSVNTLLTNIEDNSLIKVEFSVPEKYAGLIQLGSTQLFTVASDQKKYNAKIAARGASLDDRTRTLLVRAVIDNANGALLPGQSARLTLSLNSQSGLSVYSQALMPSSNGYSVYVVLKNSVSRVPVEIGQRDDGSVEITKGLNPGDTVITSNLLRLSPGTKVNLITLK